MESKTFRAPTIAQALEQIQTELGSEALVVSVREAPAGPAWQVWKSHDVEVVAMAGNDLAPPAVDLKPLGTAAVADDVPVATPPRPQASPDALVGQVERLQKKIQSLTQEMDRLSTGEWPHALSGAFQDMLDAGVDAGIARKIALVTTKSLGSWALEDPAQVRKHLSQQMTAGIKVRSEAALAKDRIICAIGARGSGKTTALAKIAHRAVQKGQSVMWICAGTTKMGSILEAQAYGDTLGIDVGLAYTPNDVTEMIAENDDRDLILVDTAGSNPFLEREVLELGAVLTAIPARVTYVVAPATAKDQDLQRLQAMAAPFNPSGLILTKLDETSSPGSAFNLAWRSQWPLVYFIHSPQLLDGFKRAHPARLVHAFFREGWLQ